LRPSRKGSLYRQLVIPFSAFMLLALVGLVAWVSWWYGRESLRRFEQVAITNAAFMDQMRLPQTRQMAERLSSVLGVEVGFTLPGGDAVGSSGDGWPEGGLWVVVEMNGEGTLRVDGHDVAIVALKGTGQRLVLSRRSAAGLAGPGAGAVALVPALILTATCGAIAFLMAHRIVRPLTLLTQWLPNIQKAPDQAEPVPESVAGRSDELGQLARSIEDTRRRLLEEQELRQRSERLATLGRIATSLAHEIRNPAAAIRMHADLLEPAADEGRLESIRLIGEEVDRITDLVNQWLFVARAAPPEKRRHELGEILAAVGRRLLPALNHAGVVLSLPAHTSDGEHAIEGDRMRLEQVVRNLLVNAVQAMPRGGEVSVGLGRRGDRVELTVCDGGSGFSEEALRRFGEPFFSEREGGMGIGLTLVREVVEAHGGTTEAWNSPSGGGMVQVSLPAFEGNHKR